MWVPSPYGQWSTSSTKSEVNPNVVIDCDYVASLVPLLSLVPGLVWNWFSTAFALPHVGGRGTHRRVSYAGAALVCALVFAGVAHAACDQVVDGSTSLYQAIHKTYHGVSMLTDRCV